MCRNFLFFEKVTNFSLKIFLKRFIPLIRILFNYVCLKNKTGDFCHVYWPRQNLVILASLPSEKLLLVEIRLFITIARTNNELFQLFKLNNHIWKLNELPTHIREITLQFQLTNGKLATIVKNLSKFSEYKLN